MQVQFSGTFVKVTKGKEFTRRSGEVDNNYTLLFENEGYVYSKPTNKMVYEKMEGEKMGDTFIFLAQYNEQFKFNKFVVEDVML